MPKLAINGGPKAIESPFPPYRSIGKEEVQAGKQVLESGELSKFFGSWNERFLGGEKVQQFERDWATHFNVKHAVSFNSLTSGLIAAVGATGIEPGDEVIVSPWTMAATAISILVWNAIPVFADIEEKTFNLDPDSIEKNITSRTKAILVPDIFGHAANLEKIKAIAKKHGLILIEDAAQAPNAKYKGRFVGTIGDIGGFSLNYHKHIHTGEGGMMVTNNTKYAERMQLIRNHAEAVVAQKKTDDLINMLGFNFRMGEIEAAIGIEQLKKLDKSTKKRTEAGTKLTQTLQKLPGIEVPFVEKNSTHVYYIYPLKLKEKELGVSRQAIVKALQAEGVPWIYEGYQLIHLLPLYQRKIAYGSKGFPWKSPIYKGKVSYKKGICPVAEKMHEKEVICLQICQHEYNAREVNLVIKAFKKVWENLGELR